MLTLCCKTNYVDAFNGTLTNFLWYFMLLQLNCARGDLSVHSHQNFSAFDLDCDNPISLGKDDVSWKKIGRSRVTEMAACRRIKKDAVSVFREDLHKRSEIRITLGNPNYIKSTPIHT